MGSVPIDLKTEREKKKISLAQIAADTHISTRYLQSIEEGRYSDLPGGVYNRAFLKAYCESINLDPQEILDSYEAQTSSSKTDKYQKSQTPLPPLQNTFSVSGPILIWTIMLLISAVGIFFSRGWISELFSPYFSEKTVAGVSYETENVPSSDPVDTSTISSDIPVGIYIDNRIFSRHGNGCCRAQKPPPRQACGTTQCGCGLETPFGNRRKGTMLGFH